VENYGATRGSLFLRRGLPVVGSIPNPPKMHCGGGQVLFMKKELRKIETRRPGDGKHGSDPEGQTMMNSFGNWIFSYTYMNEKATPRTRKPWKRSRPRSFRKRFKETETRYVAISRN